MKKQNLWLGIGVAIVVIIIFVITMSKDATAPVINNATSDSDTNVATVATGLNFNVIDPDEWTETARATKIINETQGKAVDEERVQWGVIQDPNESNIYYFATYGTVMKDSNLGPAETDDRFVGIYKYNVDNYNWERLYKSTHTMENPKDISLLIKILGYHDDRLIIREMSADYSLGPCSSSLLADASKRDGEMVLSELLALDLSNPYGGFETYTPPSDVVQQEMDAIDECVVNM